MSEKTDVWMPLFIGDYLRDTNRLTTEQHGAYMLLIMDYWTNGAPPDEDAVLASITRLSSGDWKRARQAISRLFRIADGVWHHKRIEEELKNAAENSKRNIERAKKAAAKRWGNQSSENATSNATSTNKALLNECPSPSPSPISTDVDIKDKRATRFDAQAHLVSMGVDAQIASDWITLRRAKKAPPTLRAIAGIANEAIRAGRPLPDVLEACCNRGWTGFKAEWLQSDKPINGKTHHQVIQDAQTRAIFGDSFGVGEKLITGEVVQ